MGQQVAVIEDKSFPVARPDGTHEFVGKLDPNWWCRGWNPRRTKYCRMRAGWGTDHYRHGRCKHHGGRNRIGAGLYSRVKQQELAELFDEAAAVENPLDMMPELAMLRALFVDWINRYDAWRDALLGWWAAVSQRRAQDPELAAAARLVLGEAAPRQVMDISDGYQLLSEVSKVIARAEKIAAQNAISRRDLRRIMQELSAAVARHNALTDPAERILRIRDDWRRIRF